MINVSCPICGAKMQGQSLAEWPSFPFCSKRCKTIDLGRWLDESYAIPRPAGGVPPAEEDEDVPPPGAAEAP